MNQPDVSILIVSFNTKRLLDRCFESVKASAGPVTYEIIAIDNHSSDGSAEYIRSQHPEVRLVVSPQNVGFAGANNLGFRLAKGRYIVLLNSDAFFRGQALEQAVAEMDRHPQVGLAGARLVGEDDGWQPSARTFPGLWNEAVTLLGLSHKRPQSPWFGRPDLTYRNQNEEIECDWVPGAFSIIRPQALDAEGLFDERFFLYSEEVDLCRRIKKGGWKVVYWPHLVVTHIGGASTSVFSQKLVTKSGMQMTLWRLQSQYLYHRKHHGPLKAYLSLSLERLLNQVRLARNKTRAPAKAEESRILLELIGKAWANTKGGTVSPPVPWEGA